jgi:hypothetical protein
MATSTETNAPLEIYDFNKNITPHFTKFLEDLEDFRDEIIRIVEEQCNFVFPLKYPPGHIEPAQAKRELKDAFEFRVVINPEIGGHAFDFIIKNDGLVSVELLTNSANHSSQSPFWCFTFFWKIEGKQTDDRFLKKIHGYLPAKEIYELIPLIIEYVR